MLCMHTDDPWGLMKQGRFEQAYAQMTEDMTENPNRVFRHIYNRGLCLLNLNRRAEALADFQQHAALNPDSDSGHIASGIVLWSLNQPMEAVLEWKRGFGAKYTDAAGGVQLPAILFFAASRLTDPSLEKEALTILRQKWRTKSATAWPGPIAGFLTGKLDEKAFFEAGKIDNAILERRRLTKINFWVGLACYRREDMGKYGYYLRKASSGYLLEEEYYLAKYELELLNIEF